MQFKSFLANNMDFEYGELLYHAELKWLSHGNILRYFFDLEIKSLYENEKHYIAKYFPMQSCF